MVVDNNGVLGYVSGLPQVSGGSILNIGETITGIYSVPNATATVGKAILD
ncbi:hypothetical protein [Chryseobacterium sp. G0186]|nr:hypothetical protein [Chryseobacterium sp. G0186]